MENFNKKKWEDLNLTRDEIKNIGEALKKEEFRNLLVEYVKEINDPDNRKQYEEEITQLENERGVDVKFIHPSSGYVIKTSVNGETKAFINICSNDNVGKPSSTPGVDEGHRGLKWSIPYCMAPPREDLDKKNNECMVYDVVFHSDTLHLAKSNEAFKNLVDNTALDAVEESFHISLDKVNLKFPKMAFKGAKHATVIRKKMKNFQQGEYPDIPNYPYPHPKETIDSDSKPSHSTTMKVAEKIKPNFTTPKYKIKHRNTIDMQNYTNDPLTKMSVTIPDELIIEIDLPLLKNCSDAFIDVTEKNLNLQSESPAKYKLHLNLPYQVDSNKGNAKFDNVKRVLIVTLPVVKTNAKLNSLVDLAREDSGVESDINNGRSNSVSSSDDDAVDNDHSTINENQLTEFEHESKNHEYNKSLKKFLNPKIHYITPNFSCHKVKDMLTFTLQVPNVNPDSVEYCFSSKFAGFHLTFVSIGNSFFPVHYALYVRLPTQIENETFHIEVWDNNVIAQVKLTAFDVQTFEYYAGTDEKNVKVYSLLESNDNLQEQHKSADINHPHSDEYDSNEVSNDDEMQTSNTSLGLESQAKNEERKFPDVNEKQSREEIVDHQNGNKERKLIKEIRDLSISESGASSFDESSSSPTHQKPAKCRTVSESHNGERRKSRGILKIGRSLSESSVDDYALWNDENGEKPKKTVRFSDAIQTQTFRMNSSILGQRKKNQRKLRNKKRAMERRLSESGGESEGENEVSVINKNIDDWSKDPESSDFSEVSEISDVSESAESDDGQKDDPKPFVPCSSKQNHKRRGKKSARKSASTAKFQFIEN